MNTFKTGDIITLTFRGELTQELAIICQVGPGKIQLISIPEGNRYSDIMVEVDQIGEIRLDEIEKCTEAYIIGSKVSDLSKFNVEM